MRITGGVWGSRRVVGPGKGLLLRPTPDALREQAFAVLQRELPGAVFLDLFAGSGVVSLEALSRGAAKVVLVEPDPRARALIQRNFAGLGVAPESYELLALPAERALALLAKSGVVADLAWADPPFSAFREHVPTLEKLASSRLLRPGGALVVECPPKEQLALGGFALERVLRGALLFRLRSGGSSS